MVELSIRIARLSVEIFDSMDNVLGCMVYCIEGDAFAADPWTQKVAEGNDGPFKYGIESVQLEQIVKYIVTEGNCIRFGDNFLRIESANPSGSLPGDISIEVYEEAKQADNASLMHEVVG